MSTPFQNRLVGTIIVAAAIIIFLPDILDGEKESYKEEFEAIPQTPVFSANTTAKNFPVDKLSLLPAATITDEQATDEQFIDNSTVKINTLEKEQAITPKTKLKQASKNKSTGTKKSNTQIAKTQISKSTTKKSLPEKVIVDRAWVIHLGSFKHQQNVKELLVKLKKNGYVAFTRPIKTKNGTLTKVFVGPELIKSSLEKKLPKLKSLTGVKGKVARFYPHK